MKISEHIEVLQAVLAEHGDLNCYYAADDEGNGYQKTNYAGTVFYVNHNDVNTYRPDLHSDDDVADYPHDEFNKVCVIN